MRTSLPLVLVVAAAATAALAQFFGGFGGGGGGAMVGGLHPLLHGLYPYHQQPRALPGFGYPYQLRAPLPLALPRQYQDSTQVSCDQGGFFRHPDDCTR